MEVIAKAKFVRMSSKKVRLIAGLIRGMGVSAALDQLAVIPKAASLPVAKALKSAIANAEHNFRLKEENLKVKTITVDKGPDLKRWRPRAFGRAAQILKHSCHITIIVGEKEEKKDTGTKEDKKGAVEKSAPKTPRAKKSKAPTSTKSETVPVTSER